MIFNHGTLRGGVWGGKVEERAVYTWYPSALLWQYLALTLLILIIKFRCTEAVIIRFSFHVLNKKTSCTMNGKNHNMVFNETSWTELKNCMHVLEERHEIVRTACCVIYK